MALTRDFKETIQARAARDPRFRRELLKEGVQCLLSGEVDTGKNVLRDYIKCRGLNCPMFLRRIGFLHGDPDGRC